MLTNDEKTGKFSFEKIEAKRVDVAKKLNEVSLNST
jgi:hypothetical protein